MYAVNGKYFHNTIMQTPALNHEFLTGMLAHYSIGVAFAFFLLAVYRRTWIEQPRIIPALVIGFISLLIPVFIVQPLLGFGIGFSKLQKGSILLAKISSIHLVYGIGLYLTALLTARISEPKHASSVKLASIYGEKLGKWPDRNSLN